MNQIVCQGCGAVIQTEKSHESGYTPVSALDKEPVICKRCFRLKHYNEVQDVSLTDDDFLKMISQIRDTKGLIVNIIDIFDFNGSVIPSLQRLTGNNPIILVGNKVDLLPKSTNKNKLVQWLKKSAKDMGLHVKDVLLISAANGQGFSELEKVIADLRNGQNVYVVGSTNVGKSTLINRLINNSTGINEAITTSYFPGTTLGFIDIPLDESSSLFDTPGVINRKQMAHYISEQDLKVITPKKEIKPRIFQLNVKQTLYFGGLARIDFEKGDKQSFVCYFSNQLSIHRTKLEKAEQLYDKHLGELLSPPNEETIEKIPSLISNTYRINEGKTDIVFPGLGWVTLPEGNATITAHSPEGVSVSIRKSLI